MPQPPLDILTGNGAAGSAAAPVSARSVPSTLPADRLSCPACQRGFGLAVRVEPTSVAVRRDRVCAACGHRWRTLEVAAPARAASDAALVASASSHLAAALRLMHLLAGPGRKEAKAGVRARKPRTILLRTGR